MMTIPTATLQKIMAVLARLPYDQVAGLIAEVQQNAKPVAPESPKE